LLLFDKQSRISVVPPFYRKTSANSLCLVKWIIDEANPKSEIFCFLAYLFLNCNIYNRKVFWSFENVSLGSSPSKVQVIRAADSYVASRWSYTDKIDLSWVRIPVVFKFLILSTTSLKACLYYVNIASIVGKINSIKSRSELRHLTISNNASITAYESSFNIYFWTFLFYWVNLMMISIVFGLSNF
jgi:hypothetical protein